MSADFWLNMQMRWDLFKAKNTEGTELDTIQDYQHIQKTASLG